MFRLRDAALYAASLSKRLLSETVCLMGFIFDHEAL